MELPPNKGTLHAILKGLIGAEIALFLISIPLAIVEGMMTESMLNEVGMTTNFTDAEMLSAAFALMVLVVLLPAIIASWIGLLVLCSGYLLAIPIGCFEYEFYWGLSKAIVDLRGPVEGLILGISFLSPLARDFTAAKDRSVTS